MKYRLLSGIILITLILSAATQVLAQSEEELQREIRAKADRLNQLNTELQATEQTLKQVQGQKQSLQKELSTLDTSLKQLDLKIQADGVQTEKLGLEVNSLEDELADIDISIEERVSAVSELFRQLQRVEDTSMVVILLGNGSLSAVLDEMQRMETMRQGLATDVSRLNALSAEYRQKLGLVSNKRQQVAVRQETLKNRKVIVEDQKIVRATVLQETKSQEALYQEKLAKLKAEQNAMEDEIERIESRLSARFDSKGLPTQRPGVFAWPLETVRVTQRFGERSRLYRGKPHNGMDLGISIGTPVLAANDGTVQAADNNDRSSFSKYQYGKYVLLRHDNNLATLYAHLSRYTVYPGQQVRRGEIIGYSGNTGYSTGPHLHFGLYWAPSIEMKAVPPAAGLVPVGVTLNPEDYL